MIKDYRERCIELGEYIAEHGCTVRECAAVFGVSKSTVHKDVTEKLSCIAPFLYQDVKKILDKNKAERHLRGGEATREKYRNLHAVTLRGIGNVLAENLE